MIWTALRSAAYITTLTSTADTTEQTVDDVIDSATQVTAEAGQEVNQFFQFFQVLGVGADLAALPAGDHRLIYAHGVRKLGLSQVFGLSGGGNMKLGRRERVHAFTRKTV